MNVIDYDKESGTFTLVEEEKAKTDEEIEHEASAKGMLSGIARTEFMGLPIGKAFGGLALAGGWDALRGLIGTRMPAGLPVWAVPAVGAWAVNTKMVKGWVGGEISQVAGFILLADAIQASPLSPRAWVRNLVNRNSVGSNGTNETTESAYDSMDAYCKANGLG